MATIERSIQDGGSPPEAANFHVACENATRFSKELMKIFETNDLSKHNFPEIKTQRIRDAKTAISLQQ